MKTYSILQEDFIETLKKNVKAETFKQTKQQLREKLKSKELIVGMKDLIKEELDMLIDAVYNNERNFNNADPTTHMRCLDKEEIKDILIELLKEEA